MSNIKFTMKDLDGTVMPYTSFVISTSASANAASFTTNANGEATVSLAAVSTPYYISKQDGTTESVIAYKFFVPDTTYTLDAELLFVDIGKISKDKNDKSIAALIEAKVVAVNAANRALQVVSLLGDVSTIRDSLSNLVQVASNLTNIETVADAEANINVVAGNTTNINKVATIDTNITAVADNQTNVNTVASNIGNVNTVAPHTANIGTVATNVGSINTVSESIASVNTTASNIANVHTVASNTSNISSVAGISPAVSTVANNIADIQTTAEGVGLISDVLPYTSNITTVANNIAPIVAVGNNINNINEVRAMEADIEVLADEIANIAGAAAAVTQAVDAQKVLYIAGTDYTKNTSNTLTLPYFPAKSNSVKIFFDGTYKNKDTWNRVGKNIVFTSVVNADKVEIQYEVPSSFVGLSPEDILVIQNAEAAAQASEVDAQQSATAAAVSASLAQGVANQAVDAIKQLFVAGTGFTKGVSTQLTMDFTPVKTNAVKVFFDGIYQNKNTFTRVGKVLTFNEAINVDNVEIHYEVPSQFVGLDDDDNAVLVAAQYAAQASANAAAASFDSFDDRYLGAKATAPTVDNDGNALIVGAKYFNSTESKMYVRGASAWQLDTADSGSVNFTPAGAGAVATTVQNKLRQYIAANDFLGVDPTGATDSTVGLRAAFDYAVPLGRQIELDGIYVISGPIQPYGTRVSGGLHIVCNGDVQIIVNPAASGFSDVLYFHTTTYNNATIVGGSLTIDGSNKAGRGITIRHEDTSGGYVNISALVKIKNILETNVEATRENGALAVVGRYSTVVIERPFIQNVNRTNAAGATKGISVSQLSGICTINQPYVENVLCVSSANNDADGIAVFGYQSGTIYNARQGSAYINEPTIINCQGRSFKGQISDVVIYRPRIKRTGGVVAIANGADFDFQASGTAVLHEPCYEYYETNGVSPFSVASSSFSSVVFQQTLDDREMSGRAVGGTMYTQVQLPRYALITLNATSKKSTCQVTGLCVLPVGTFASSAFSRAIIEFNAAAAVAKSTKTDIEVSNVKGPIQCYAIGYTNYGTGALTSTLNVTATDLVNTLGPASAARPFNQLSGSPITAVAAFTFKNLNGFRDLQAAGWTFTFNQLQAGTTFTVDIASVVATGAPAWGASGYAFIECVGGGYFGATDKNIRVHVNNATAANSVFYTRDGGATWGTIR